MAKHGRAIIHRQPNDQYTVLVYSRASDEADEQLDSATAGLTLTNAFNGARDALAAMATGNEKHRTITMNTRIT